MSHDEKRKPALVKILIILQLLLAIGALPAGVILFAAPDGHVMKMPLSMLKYSPFHDFRIPGAILAVFLGVFPLAIAYGLWRRSAWRWPNALNPFKKLHWSWAGSLAAGVILLIWITVEIIMLRAAVWVHDLYLAWGLAIILVTLASPVKRHFSNR